MSAPEGNVNNTGYNSPGYGNSGYNNESSGYGNSGYNKTPEAKQGNFDDGYRENVYDRYNLGDSAYTDSVTNPNPQLEL